MAIIEHGKVIEMDTPAALVARHCPERRVVFSCDREGVSDLFRAIPDADSVRADGARYAIDGRGEDFVTAVIHVVAEQGLHVRDVRTILPTLEDVFLKLTGHRIRD